MKKTSVKKNTAKSNINNFEKTNIETFSREKELKDKDWKLIKRNIMSKPIKFFIGKNAQIRMEVVDKKSKKIMIEWLWVIVKKISENGKNLIGILDNNSIYDDKIKVGKQIVFTQDDIRLTYSQEELMPYARYFKEKTKSMQEFLSIINNIIIEMNIKLK
jgi:hypothetical protein